MTFSTFFKKATDGLEPYSYQERLASTPWADVLDVPTGMGKTAAVTLAWLYKRGWREGARGESVDADTPRRLVWCLPMRVLVEQTEESIRCWLKRLGVLGDVGSGKVSVHVLMGGADDLKTWAEFPEQDMILIGTQDMLLSRALMRGYGMSRYQWPIHFSLLHNDCLWVFDEVQLMGAGLATSAQLEAFRRIFPLAKNSRTLWVSATLNHNWLATVDMRPHLGSLIRHGIGDADYKQASERLRAIKTLERTSLSLTKEAGNKAGLQSYLEVLRDTVLEAHDATSQTLVIVNSVTRAQQLFSLLREQRQDRADLLIHGRFRATERSEQTRRLRDDKGGVDRIIVATQAIEAGVDISSRVLVTELAPWTSMVQRFGRCNRYGEHNADGARVLWVNIDDDADALPYTTAVLAAARSKLTGLASASPHDLPATDEAQPLTAVLRRKDLLDLFNTDPDLSGFDVDVSDYIRDSGQPGVQVFWRDFKDDPNNPEPQSRPERAELCPASMSQARDFSKRKDVVLWYWDSLDSQWTRLTRDPRPGIVLLARAADGGYDRMIGFDPALKKSPVPPIPGDKTRVPENFSGDWRSRQNKPVSLTEHLAHVADHATQLCAAVSETTHRNSVVRAGRWHDLGKAHEVFDATMHTCAAAPSGLLAKSPCNGRHSRKFFRHELASMLGWLAQHDGEADADLIAYLILAHHGKVRMSLRAMPTEADQIPPGVKRFARGVYEGDSLPALQFDGEHSSEITLKLALMELGEGEQGPSWTERSLKLLDQYGPFQLAWLETLVRLADWRASAAEQLESHEGGAQNGSHELDRSHPSLAQPASAGTTAAASGQPSPQGGAQHGVRGGAGGSGDAGSRTHAPHAATHYLDTTLGILSYAELAPHLARHVEAVQHAIGAGQFDAHPLDEELLLDLHRRLCVELTPDFAGRWRKQAVVVGSHNPPQPFEVAPQMRQYVDDLRARIAALPTEPDDGLLETLAFAEGRLLSIHPFADFNGRVTRVFIDWLTRQLNLPDVDPTPDTDAATERYLAALREGDRMHWQPLMEIWRQRFGKEEGP